MLAADVERGAGEEPGALGVEVDDLAQRGGFGEVQLAASCSGEPGKTCVSSAG